MENRYPIGQFSNTHTSFIIQEHTVPEPVSTILRLNNDARKTMSFGCVLSPLDAEVRHHDKSLLMTVRLASISVTVGSSNTPYMHTIFVHVEKRLQSRHLGFLFREKGLKVLLRLGKVQ